jgi:ABC-type Na+ efflux pump permease subunit
MADVQATRETHPTTSERANEAIGGVNVYDTTPNTSSEPHTVTATETAPATRSSPALMTWLLILLAVIIALYFVVQFLT